MIRLIFLFLPLFVVLILGPLMIARAKRGATTWFPAQLMALFGLVAGIVLLRNDTFGDIGGPMHFVVLTLCPAAALVVAALVLPGRET